MTRTILASRHFVAALLAMVTGMVLFYSRPFPEEHLFLKLIAKHRPLAFQSFRWLYRASLFTTPYMMYIGILSALYVGTLKFRPHVVAGQLPRYPDPRRREDLFVVLGEVHDQRRPDLRPAATGERVIQEHDIAARDVHGFARRGSRSS